MDNRMTSSALSLSSWLPRKKAGGAEQVFARPKTPLAVSNSSSTSSLTSSPPPRLPREKRSDEYINMNKRMRALQRLREYQLRQKQLQNSDVRPTSSSSRSSSTASTASSSRLLLPEQQQQQQHQGIGEVIESHFVYENSVYFIVYNAAAGHVAIKERTPSMLVAYSIKPLWYMAHTPALKRYYDQKISVIHKQLVPADYADGLHAYNNPTPKGKANIYLAVVEAFESDPQTHTELYEYYVNIPPDWGQLAYYRLLHYNIDRIMACALMQTTPPDESTTTTVTDNDADDNDAASSKTSVAVYVVRYQNETVCELVPAHYLIQQLDKSKTNDKITDQVNRQQQNHIEVALDFWEEAVVQDSRLFRSASTIDFSSQNSALKDNSGDDFWVKCAHRFVGRKFWTDENGRWMPGVRAKAKLFVYRWVDWPLTICWVADELEGIENDRPDRQTDATEDETDPEGFDEYAELICYDKFIPRAAGISNLPSNKSTAAAAVDVDGDAAAVQSSSSNGNMTMVNGDNLSRSDFKKFCNPQQYTAHIPPKWRSVGVQHVLENRNVKILAVVRQAAIANVYLVKWPQCAHATIVTSLSLRKRFGRAMLRFFEDNAFLPRLEVMTKKQQTV